MKNQRGITAPTNTKSIVGFGFGINTQILRRETFTRLPALILNLAILLHNIKFKFNNIPQRTSSQASAKYIEFELAMASTAFYTFHSYSR